MANAAEQKAQPESAPPTIPRDPKERKEWYDRMRTTLGKSRFIVEKFPGGLTPYWARKDDKLELSRLESLGFKIFKDDPKAPRIVANGLNDDGTYVLGDVILMSVPTEMYEFYLEDNRDRARMLVQGVPDAFQQNAGEQDVPTFLVDEKKIK